MSLLSDQIKQVLLENLDKVRTIADLAQLLGLPYWTLWRQFNDEERDSLGRYMTHLRVEQAKKLLLNSNCLCKKICYLVGFSSQVVGAHVFKRFTGITMEDYRKRNQSEP